MARPAWLTLSAARERARAAGVPDAEFETSAVLACRMGELMVAITTEDRRPRQATEAERPELVLDFDTGDALLEGRGPLRLIGDVEQGTFIATDANLGTALLHAGQLDALLASVAAPDTAARPRGGRPEKYRWKAYGIEAARWVYQRGLPDPVGLLIAHLRETVDPAHDEVPSDEELRRFINQLAEACRREIARA